MGKVEHAARYVHLQLDLVSEAHPDRQLHVGHPGARRLHVAPAPGGPVDSHSLFISVLLLYRSRGGIVVLSTGCPVSLVGCVAASDLGMSQERPEEGSPSPSKKSRPPPPVAPTLASQASPEPAYSRVDVPKPVKDIKDISAMDRIKLEFQAKHERAAHPQRAGFGSAVSRPGSAGSPKGKTKEPEAAVEVKPEPKPVTHPNKSVWARSKTDRYGFQRLKAPYSAAPVPSAAPYAPGPGAYGHSRGLKVAADAAAAAAADSPTRQKNSSSPNASESRKGREEPQEDSVERAESEPSQPPAKEEPAAEPAKPAEEPAKAQPQQQEAAPEPEPVKPADAEAKPEAAPSKEAEPEAAPQPAEPKEEAKPETSESAASDAPKSEQPDAASATPEPAAQ